MTYERKSIVESDSIPNGYEVSYHEIRGYDSPDRWFEAHHGNKKLRGTFSSIKDAVEACISDMRNKS